jgi:cobalt-zinc-cadmium efflux system protein
VKEIHDLHVWNPSAETIALAVHITVPDQMLNSVDQLAQRIREILLKEFKIDHPILQFESTGCNDSQLLCRIAEGNQRRSDHD